LRGVSWPGRDFRQQRCKREEVFGIEQQNLGFVRWTQQLLEAAGDGGPGKSSTKNDDSLGHRHDLSENGLS
jgi:hypothetical protein